MRDLSVTLALSGRVIFMMLGLISFFMANGLLAANVKCIKPKPDKISVFPPSVYDKEIGVPSIWPEKMPPQKPQWPSPIMTSTMLYPVPKPIGDDVFRDTLWLEAKAPGQKLLELRGCLHILDGMPVLLASFYRVELEFDENHPTAKAWFYRHAGEEISVLGEWYQYKTMHVIRLERVLRSEFPPIKAG